MKRPRNPIFTATAAVLLLSGGCAPSRAPAHPPASPSTGEIRRGDFEDRFLLSGELRAVRSLKVTVPRVPNWSIALRWLAPEGGQVQAGDPVAQLDSSTFVSGLEDQRQALAEQELEFQKTRAELEIQRLQKSLEVTRARVERDKARLEAQVPEALRAPREFQEKQLALEKAEAALSRAQRDLQALLSQEKTQLAVLSIQTDKARRQVRKTEAFVESLTLRAPQAGLLLHGVRGGESRKWVVGDILQPGQTVVELPDLSEMYVEARLSDLDDAMIAPGMPARCRLDAQPDRVFQGTVAFVNAAAQELSDANGTIRFIRVRVDLPRSDPSLMRPGMSAKVEVIRRRLEDRLLVPRALLDLNASPPRLSRKIGGPLAVQVEACGPLECALLGDPSQLALHAALP